MCACVSICVCGCECVSLKEHTAVSAAAAKTPCLVCDSLKHADVSAAETFMSSPLSVKMAFNVPSASGLKCSKRVCPKPLKSV